MSPGAFDIAALRAAVMSATISFSEVEESSSLLGANITAVTVAGKYGNQTLVFIARLLCFGLGVFLILVLVATRESWWPPIYNGTCASWRCPKLRNITCVGWCSALLCPCFFGRYHEKFRLRIALQRGWNLRQADYFTKMSAYVLVKCGNNPVKSSSSKVVPSNNSTTPVSWYDCIDLEIGIADEYISLQVVDHDALSADDVIGTVILTVSEFFFDMEGSLSEVKSMRDVKKQLIYCDQNAGTLEFSLFATKPGRALPAVLPGMDAPREPGEAKPLLQAMYAAFGR